MSALPHKALMRRLVGTAQRSKRGSPDQSTFSISGRTQVLLRKACLGLEEAHDGFGSGRLVFNITIT